MPCYDPPGADQEHKTELLDRIDKYVATLKGIEDFCNELVRVYADDPKRKPERVTAQSILAIINMHWGKP